MDTHLTMTELLGELTREGNSPQDHGRLEMIVCRPDIGQRLVLERAELDAIDGLVGDNWRARGSRHTDDGSAHPEMQIAIMNSRIIQAIARDRSRWPLAGDQLFIDLDISHENLPTGQRIAIGTAVLEITPYPHFGCKKFTERFGHDVIRFVNAPEAKAQRRRGVYARVVQPGTICMGDDVTKIGTER
jgi:hypothetical protein